MWQWAQADLKQSQVADVARTFAKDKSCFYFAAWCCRSPVKVLAPSHPSQKINLRLVLKICSLFKISLWIVCPKICLAAKEASARTRPPKTSGGTDAGTKNGLTKRDPKRDSQLIGIFSISLITVLYGLCSYVLFMNWDRHSGSLQRRWPCDAVFALPGQKRNAFYQIGYDWLTVDICSELFRWLMIFHERVESSRVESGPCEPTGRPFRAQARGKIHINHKLQAGIGAHKKQDSLPHCLSKSVHRLQRQTWFNFER